MLCTTSEREAFGGLNFSLRGIIVSAGDGPSGYQEFQGLSGSDGGESKGYDERTS